MRIAFCISGHLRDYKSLTDNFFEFKTFCEKFGTVDTFIATWDKISTKYSWSAAHNLTLHKNTETKVRYQDISDHYKTKDVIIFDDEFYSSDRSPLKYQHFTKHQYNWDHRGISNNVIHSTRMFFLIHQANVLKLNKEYSNNIKYDLVIRLRPDMLFHKHLYESIDFNKILHTNKIFIVPHSMPHKNHISYCDRFIIGSSNLMDKLSSTMYNLSIPFNRNIFGDPEDVLFHAIHNIIDQDKIEFMQPIENIISENSNFLR